jgi:hypothetical protein
MATRARGRHRRGNTDGKEAVQMTRLRRAFAWLTVSLLVLLLVATLLLDEAS